MHQETSKPDPEKESFVPLTPEQVLTGLGDAAAFMLEVKKVTE